MSRLRRGLLIGGTPQGMGDVIRQDAAMYGKILQAAGIEPQ